VLLAILRETARKYRKELTEAEIKLWIEALEKYTPNRIAEAFKAHIRDAETCQFFPVEGQILGRLKPMPSYCKPWKSEASETCPDCGGTGFKKSLVTTRKGNVTVERCPCRLKEQARRKA
jgi:hypothetical protein